MMKKKKATLFVMIVVIVLCIGTIAPFVWMISTSFKPPEEVYSYPPKLIASQPTINGYKTMITESSSSFDFKVWILNSCLVSIFTTLFSLIIATLAGYGLSRYKYKGRMALGYILITTQVIPGSLLIIPLYVIMGNLDLLDSFIGLIMAYTTFSIPFCTWMMKGFFDTISTSLDEAAKIDGANRLTIYTKVVLPLTLPGLVATGVFSFITGWNEYLFASVFMKSYDKWTLPMGIASFQGQYSTDWSALMAGAVIITLPIVIIFLVLQKHLVGGMTAGAVKQ